MRVYNRKDDDAQVAGPQKVIQSKNSIVFIHTQFTISLFKVLCAYNLTGNKVGTNVQEVIS